MFASSSSLLITKFLHVLEVCDVPTTIDLLIIINAMMVILLLQQVLLVLLLCLSNQKFCTSLNSRIFGKQRYNSKGITRMNLDSSSFSKKVFLFSQYLVPYSNLTNNFCSCKCTKVSMSLVRLCARKS